MAVIKHRRDTSANWTATNPVLGSGEIGLETNTRLFKFGDGVTVWTALGYSMDPSPTSHITNATNAHAASAISIVDAGNLLTGVNVETALQELANGSLAVNVVAASGVSQTLPLMPKHKVTMSASCTFTFPTITTAGFMFELWLLGAFTPTFPASVDWNAGLAPTYADDSLYGFTTFDSGANWLGALVAKALA